MSQGKLSPVLQILENGFRQVPSAARFLMGGIAGVLITLLVAWLGLTPDLLGIQPVWASAGQNLPHGGGATH